jgi:predicted alpha/beta superfamily hydrolase
LPQTDECQSVKKVAIQDLTPVKRVLRGVWSPQRNTHRDIDVYLPHSYRRSRARYPVVYMQDGQNLSDPDRAFSGTWNLETTIAALARAGLETIFVGVPNMGEERLREYSPFFDLKHGGGDGDAYLAYLERTVKPLVDRKFRTRPEREATGLFGSSMGALIALYAFFRAPETFGFAGAMSPALWFAGRALLSYIERDGAPPGRIYMDVGTGEGAATLRDARQLARILERKGYGEDRFRFIEAAGGEHSEAHWGARLPPALEFLIRPIAGRRQPGVRSQGPARK